VPELPELAAFAKAEFEADGVPKGAVAVTSGGLDAIERTLRDHLRAGDRVIVEDPTFPALLDVLASLGVAPEPCGLDEEGPRPDLVERALSPNVRAVVLSSRGQNPTGAALSVRRAANLARVLSRRPHVLVVELDDASAVAGVPLATVTADRLRWIVVRSLSKLLGPDVRIAVVTGDATTIARLRHRQAASIRWVSHLLQTVAHGLWSDPASARRLVRVAEVYAERRIALVTELASRGFEVHPRSGFNVWIPVREEAATVLALAECGWAVAAGERFRLKSPPAIRVTTSTLSPSDARRFAADLAAVHRGAPLPPERVRSSHD
jgi:DNA-binding transcriptional MocR family regulator